MNEKSYKIKITKSCFGHYFWTLMGLNDKKLAESNMITNYQQCWDIVTPLSKKLNANVLFYDLEKDCEL